MAVQIVFTDTTKVRVQFNGGPAELARELATKTGPQWVGNFMRLDRTKGKKMVWVNPDAVAYLEEWPDD